MCDLQILLGFAYILPLLKSMHVLIKFAKMKDVFVCDLVAAIKVCQGDLYNMYLEKSFNFTANTFWAFKSLFECNHENIHTKLIPNLNSKLQHLAFEVNGQHIWTMHHDLETMTPTFVIESIYVVVESLVKNQCKGKFLKLYLLACLIVFFQFVKSQFIFMLW
jgi:hypothetical protein